MKTIYIAGPMTGYKNLNFFAFDQAKLKLQSEGWNVISPADIDRANGFDATIDGMEFDASKQNLALCLSRDILALGQCDAIYMLKGWEASLGANIERLFSQIVKLEVLFQEDDEPS